jgi:hypothetical protein
MIFISIAKVNMLFIRRYRGVQGKRRGGDTGGIDVDRRRPVPCMKEII